MLRHLRLTSSLVALSAVACAKESAAPEVADPDAAQTVAVTVHVAENGRCRIPQAGTPAGNWAWTGPLREGGHASIVHFSGRPFAVVLLRTASSDTTQIIAVHPDEAVIHGPRLNPAQGRTNARTPLGRELLALVRAARARCGAGAAGS